LSTRPGDWQAVEEGVVFQVENRFSTACDARGNDGPAAVRRSLSRRQELHVAVDAVAGLDELFVTCGEAGAAEAQEQQLDREIAHEWV
jgi:hypothetical protein